jgi:hypothetical protein
MARETGRTTDIGGKTGRIQKKYFGGLNRISRTFLLRGGQVLAWLRQKSAICPLCMRIRRKSG